MRSSGHGWLGMLVALAGVKSVPIGTVFRSKGQKCTNLVRFSGFLILLSRLSLLFKGFYQCEDRFRRGVGLDAGRQQGDEAETPTREPDLPQNITTITP